VAPVGWSAEADALANGVNSGIGTPGGMGNRAARE
jgi:hypothetical protein